MLIYVLHYAVLQALSKCFKGRHTMLARGYRQYGMMFVFCGYRGIGGGLWSCEEKIEGEFYC